MKQRQRLLALKQEVNCMEEEVTERENRLCSWQDRVRMSDTLRQEYSER